MSKAEGGASSLKYLLWAAPFILQALQIIVPVAVVYALIQANPLYRLARGITNYLGSFGSAGTAEITGPRVTSLNGHPHLNLPVYNQQTYWDDMPNGNVRGEIACGATSVKMSLDYYAHFAYPNLRNINTLEKTAYYNRYITSSNERGHMKTKEPWLEHVPQGAYVEKRISHDGWQDLKKSIASYHPVVAYGGFSSRSGGHIVAIAGIDDTHIVIVDPINRGGKGHIRAYTLEAAINILPGSVYSGSYLINNDGPW